MIPKGCKRLAEVDFPIAEVPSTWRGEVHLPRTVGYVALVVGCEAFASDINPVADLILI